jgi:hypothetical protein
VIKRGDPGEQTKRLKYMNLAANAVMLQNVVDLTGVVNAAAAEELPVTRDLIGRLSPYMRATFAGSDSTCWIWRRCPNRCRPTR